MPYVLPSGFPARSLYANHNLVLYLNSINHPTLHLADWNTYSAGHPEWFGTDGIHLTAAGTMALASYIARTARPVRRLAPPPPPPAPPPPPPPDAASAGDDRAADDGGRHDDERHDHDRRGHDDDLTVRGGGTRRRLA